MENGVTNLYVTRNFGATWAFTLGSVQQANWADAGLDREPEGTMLAISSDLTFMTTKDYFNTTDLTLTKAYIFVFYKRNTLIARASNSGGFELWSSVDGEIYNRAVFPKPGPGIQEKKYTILDLGDGGVFVNVELSTSSSYGTTYGSDQLDREFSEILRYNKRSTNGAVDFRRIFGLEGIYVANRYNTSEPKYAQSVITYNKGADWKTLKAPATDIDNNNINCGKYCSLNLLGRTDSARFHQLYSNDNAIGIIIANGNVGDYLVSDQSKLNTYLSHDAGNSWIQIGKGPHVFEVANHGAITLFAEDGQPTNNLKYSWTQGLSHYECSFTSQPVLITGIATEPDNKARTFIIYGTRDGKGVLVHVDFNTAVRECTADDFEQWSPLGSKCLLGERYVYTRRKQDRPCAVNLEHESKEVISSCPCTEEDYECDFCYSPTGSRPSLCRKVCDDFDPTKEPPECIDYWFETKGYRLVPGNKCDRSSPVSKALEPTQRRCGFIPDDKPDTPTSDKRLSAVAAFGIALVIVFILVSGLVVGVLILSVTSQKFRNRVPQLLSYLPPLVSEDEVRPRSSAGYARVNRSGNSFEEDNLNEDEDSSHMFGSSTSHDDDDAFNPRL